MPRTMATLQTVHHEHTGAVANAATRQAQAYLDGMLEAFKTASDERRAADH